MWNNLECIHLLNGQSKDATCDDYSMGDSAIDPSITPEIEDVTSLTTHNGCETDGKALPFSVSEQYRVNKRHARNSAVYYHNIDVAVFF